MRTRKASPSQIREAVEQVAERQTDDRPLGVPEPRGVEPEGEHREQGRHEADPRPHQQPHLAAGRSYSGKAAVALIRMTSVSGTDVKLT